VNLNGAGANAGASSSLTRRNIMTAESARRERLIKLALCCDLARLFRACELAEKRLGYVPDSEEELTSGEIASINATPLSADEVNRVARVFSLEDLRRQLPEAWQAQAEQTADRMLTRSPGTE
jgi:hypothetical protein